MTNIVPTLSKMSLNILNFEKTLFPALQEQLGILSSKEEKLMRILELAQIELYVSEVNLCLIVELSFVGKIVKYEYEL
jgi:hypothetical protein